MAYERFHWRVYNVGWRIFGLMAVAASLAFSRVRDRDT